jgi:hypothetical protein
LKFLQRRGYTLGHCNQTGLLVIVAREGHK